MTLRNISHSLTLTLIIAVCLLSCGSDNPLGPSAEEPDNCSLHPVIDGANFFDRGDYSFSCISDNDTLSVEYPYLANNHLITSENEDAVQYIISATYKETKDKALGSFIFAEAFANSLTEDKTAIDGLGAVAYFYIIPEEAITRHYIVFRDCNFVGTIAGQYNTSDGLPCNLGKDVFVQFAKEMLKNI